MIRLNGKIRGFNKSRSFGFIEEEKTREGFFFRPEWIEVEVYLEVGTKVTFVPDHNQSSGVGVARQIQLVSTETEQA